MPTWNEQLEEIRRRREERDRRDAELYAAQIQLRTARRRLESARGRHTAAPRNPARVAELRRAIAALEQKRRSAAADDPETRRRIAGEQRRLAEALNRELGQAEGDVPRIEGEVAGLQGTYERAKAELGRSRAGLQAAIVGLVPGHPEGVLSNLRSEIPFLLLPLRIESRFVSQNGTDELWVRVYPDDIAVHTHENTLTPQEIEGGEKYWTELWGAAGPDTEPARKKAWNYLVEKFGAQRAAWVARETKPVNWDVQPRPAAPAFPLHDLSKPSAWSRAPRSAVMPDRLVIIAYEGTEIVIQREGAVIPDELIVGPDPLEEDDAFVTSPDGRLVFGEEFAWASDFAKAVEIGMAFKIPITPQQAARGFDRLVVLGLVLSRDAHDGKQALETLLDNHHYSPKGIALVRQGTPTNNTDEGGSGFTTSDPAHANSYDADAGAALFSDQDDTDGRRLADALGIEYATLQHVSGADATDCVEAVRMNTALYPGTLGYYFDTMMEPVLPERTRDALREFFVEHVSDRGPLPAIRIGNQPYGILVTSDFHSWQTSRRDAARFTPGFLSGLHETLKRYHAVWTDLAGRVPHAGMPGGTDSSATLLDILGLQAGSVAFHQRNGYSTDYLHNLDSFQFGGRYFEDMRANFTSKNELLAFLQSLGYAQPGSGTALQVPQLLRLVFQHFQTRVDAANLVDSVPLSEKNGIRYYDETLKKNYLHWLSEAQVVDALERQDFGPGRPAPNQLLYLMLRRAFLLQLHAAAVQWFFNRQVDLRPTLAATNMYNIRPAASLTKWEAMRAPVGTAIARHPLAAKAVSDFLLTVGRDEEEADFLGRVRSALTSLSELPTARLERLLTEHIDVLTYRLDSWVTGMFSLRLQQQRALSGLQRNPERTTGLYLGAFGWVENLRRSPKRQVELDTVPEPLRPAGGQPLFEYLDNGGFIHTPSLNHATAAAVLRSGYLSHAASNRPQAMAVNLSSEHIRRALFILQGVRNGQTLEALLGYQFERGLHDRASADAAQIRLNEYVHDFRAAFPIEQHYIRQQGTTESVQAIPANNVVNGVKLAGAAGDVPYGATGGVATASPAERASIGAEKDRLADTLDAVKDLLTSEAVYQLVLGNPDRAGAVATAMKDTNVPPELDVISTPRGSRFSFTNRLAVAFADLDPEDGASNPWSPIAMTARAILEPGLNHWLGGVLGDPAQLFFRVAHLDANGAELGSEDVTLDELQLQPINLVYITGNELNTGLRQEHGENRTSASELESRIAWYYRDRHGLADDVPIRIQFLDPHDKRTLGRSLVLVRMLKGLITDSRPLHALDFDPPSKKSVTDAANPEGFDLTDLPGKVQRAIDACDTLRAGIELLPIDAIVADENGVEHHHLTLAAAFAALAAAKLTFADVTFAFAGGDAALLQTHLIAMSTLGVADSFPIVQNVSAAGAQAALLDQAMSVSRRSAAMSAQAATLAADALAGTTAAGKTRLYVSAIKAIAGEMFVVLPKFDYHNEPDIALSNADRSQLLAHATTTLGMRYPAEEWLQNAGHVRPRAARWESIVSLHEDVPGARLALRPIQLPYRANDSWLAVEFPANDPGDPSRPFNIEHDTLSIVVHGDSAFTPATSRSGLLIDDWTETIPTNSEITGISFNFNQPAATPPQALLLAIAPKETGSWTWPDLVAIVNDTLQRSKLRAVEPRLLDQVDRSEVNVLLPAILADFSQYDLNVALDFRLATKFVADTVPIVAIANRHL